MKTSLKHKAVIPRGIKIHTEHAKSLKPKLCGCGVDPFFNDALRYLPAGKIIETAIVSDTIRARELVVSQYKAFMLQLHTRERVIAYRRFHCVKSVQIRSHFWSIFFCSRTEYGPEITPYLGNSHAVFSWCAVTEI